MLQTILILLPFIFAPVIPAPIAAQYDVRIDLYTRLTTGQLSLDPAQWDDIDRKMLFQNFPAEYQQPYIESLRKLLAANLTYCNERAELFKILHPPLREEDWETQEEQSKEKEVLSGNYRAAARRMNREYGRNLLHHHTRNAFSVLPNWIDAEKATEYWNVSAEELIFMFDTTAEVFLQIAEDQKNVAEQYRQMKKIDEGRLPFGLRTATDFRFPGFQREHPPLTDEQKEQLAKIKGYTPTADYSIAVPLTDEQKSRVAKDEPLFRSVDLQQMFFHHFPRFAELEYMKEIRDAERAAWKIEATPELAKLAIDQEDIVRWNASFMLLPLVLDIAERCEDIDIAPLQTSFWHGMLATVGASGPELSSPVPNLEALIQNEKDIVFLNRQLTRAETDRWGNQLMTVPFAKDAIVFVQNKHNPVRDLPLEQYREIFSGEQQTWSYGDDITLFIRPENLWSAEVARTLLGLDIEGYKARAYNVHTGTMGGVISGGLPTIKLLESASNGGIAFSTYHYDRYLALSTFTRLPSPFTRIMGVNSIFPNAETIASGEYPLVYECVLVHRKNPGEKVDRLVRWLLSEEGQKLVRSVGYVPIK